MTSHQPTTVPSTDTASAGSSLFTFFKTKTSSHIEIPPDHPFTNLICLTCGREISFPKYCGNRFCPFCTGSQHRRVRSRLDSFFKKHHISRYSLKMITLTLSSYDDLKLMVSDLRLFFSRFRRSVEWLKHAQGGAYVIEITRNPDTSEWHAHVHALCSCDYWDKYELCDSWLNVSGSPIAWISDVWGDPSRYLTKHLDSRHKSYYLLKNHLEFMNDALRNARLFQSFGTWFNSIPSYKKQKAKCKCGDPHFVTDLSLSFNIRKGYWPTPGGRR